MTNLKRLGSLGLLTWVLTLPALAGEPPAPCAPNPGEIQSPPCASAQSVSDETTSIQITPASDTTDVVITRAAIGLLQSALLIF